jgi:hypothetical protein
MNLSKDQGGHNSRNSTKTSPLSAEHHLVSEELGWWEMLERYSQEHQYLAPVALSERHLVAW